jgi:hypothetical protein
MIGGVTAPEMAEDAFDATTTPLTALIVVPEAIETPVGFGPPGSALFNVTTDPFT